MQALRGGALYVLIMKHTNSYPESDRMVALSRRKGHPAGNPGEHASRNAGLQQQFMTALAATRAKQLIARIPARKGAAHVWSMLTDNRSHCTAACGQHATPTHRPASPCRLRRRDELHLLPEAPLPGFDSICRDSQFNVNQHNSSHMNTASSLRGSPLSTPPPAPSTSLHTPRRTTRGLFSGRPIGTGGAESRRLSATCECR